MCKVSASFCFFVVPISRGVWQKYTTKAFTPPMTFVDRSDALVSKDACSIQT